MDPRLKRRIVMFYVAGFINLALGFYVLFQGGAVLGRGTWLLLLAFFFGFAAVDFWFPRAITRRWLEEQAKQAGARIEAKG